MWQLLLVLLLRLILAPLRQPLDMAFHRKQGKGAGIGSVSVESSWKLPLPTQVSSFSAAKSLTVA